MSFSLFSKFSRKPSSGITCLVVGLGNPGSKYAFTRHNAGFLALDMLCQKEKLTIKKSKFQALCGEWNVGDERALLMKPQTFMNNSGDSIREAAAYYKIAPGRIIVLVDDTALNPGIIRIRKGGSPGGHNGLKSIEAQLCTSDYPRVRIGVGAKPAARDMIDWVLSVPNQKEKENLLTALEKCCAALPALVKDEYDAAMNLYNR